MSDPFSSSIVPIEIGTIPDSYSVKIISKQPVTNIEQINVFGGTFIGEPTTRAVGLQNVIMNGIESVIQQQINGSYLIGPLPRLGRPDFFTYEGSDTLVSFAGRNDYFIFRGTGSSRKVYFVSLGQADELYEPGLGGAPASMMFVSASAINSYTVSFSDLPDSKIDITDNLGNQLIFDIASATVRTYAKNSGTPSNMVASSPALAGGFTGFVDATYFSEIGVTIFPATVPADPNDIYTAQGVRGFFYNQSVDIGIPVTPTPLVNYVISADPNVVFTTAQQNCVSRFCRGIFNPLRNAVRAVINRPNVDAFSSNNGYGAYANVGNVSFEVRTT